MWNFFDRGLSVPFKPKNLREKFLYRWGRYLALRHKNVSAGKNCLFHPGAKINPRGGRIHFGEGCIVGDGACIQGNVHFGDHCSVQVYSILTGYGTIENPSGQITIGNGVRIAPQVMMIAGNHVFEDVTRPIHQQGLKHAPITIEDDVWIAGRVNLMAGVTIGKGSVVGAGSVVTRSIPPMSIAVGSPAKVIKSRQA